jgi:hypothetical protein
MNAAGSVKITQNALMRYLYTSEKGFLRDLRASARVQTFQLLVAACLSVQSFAENSAFSEKFVLLRFLCVLLFQIR